MAETIKQDDWINVHLMQELWLKYMTNGLTLEKIEWQHHKLVQIAKQAGISISSEKARGIA